LQENQQVLKYDLLRHLSLLFKHPDLLKQIHKSIEFRAADNKRRKETIKVRTINHLHEELEQNYNEHLFYTIVYNYLLSCHQNSIAAKKHHNPINVQDPIFGKQVIIEYVDMKNIPFLNVKFSGSDNSIDNFNCNKAGDLLATNNGFLLPLVIGKDSYYINLIHLLEYYNKEKIQRGFQILGSEEGIYLHNKY
ncbi:1044_t:CDS:2, partial [Cetraspora pellucida]